MCSDEATSNTNSKISNDILCVSGHSLEDYMSYNNNKNSWRCVICQKEFRAKHHVKVHVQTNHFENDPEQCHICMKWMKNKFSLRCHISKIHRKEVK